MNSSAQLTRTERLDRLPVTPKHKRLLVGSGIGWALDAMDIGLVSFILAALAAQWNLDNTTTGWIASVGFVGMAIGASLGGLLADKIGRRQVFAATLLLYGLATGASALAWSVASLMVFRFLWASASARSFRLRPHWSVSFRRERFGGAWSCS